MNMKRVLISYIALTLLAGAPLAPAATIFFSDNFSNGSTLNDLAPAEPTINSASYQLSSSKSWNPAPTLTSGDLKFGIATTTGGGIEVQALFTTNPVALVLPGDYIRMTVTFTNTAGLLTAAGLWGFGLYNGAQVAPLAGGLNATALNSATDKVAGGVQNWQGYWGQRGYTGENSRIVRRLAQTTGVDNRNQNLTSTGSGSQSYASPAGATVGSQSTAPSGALVVGNTYTVVLRIDLISDGTLAITNTYYDGPDTTGTVVSTFGAEATGANFFTSSFDGLAIGWRARANTTGGTVMDITSITVDGSATVITTPPDIVTQPVPVTVPSGGSCAYSVVAQGFGMTYQWHRYGTNLVNGDNISGATSPDLVISPASAADVAAGADGYYVTVTGTGGYTTNSVKCSLTLGTASSLVWSGAGSTWDLGTSASWLKVGNPATFNYGDAVTFNDTAAFGNLLVTLDGNYLSASSVTVDTSPGVDYVFAGTGSFAGPGTLIYEGAGLLTMNSPNSYTGGTIISNQTAYLVLNNYNALGNGPVTLAKAGGQMEIVPAGNASYGIVGDVIVADDFNIIYDATSAYGAVFLGKLSGTSGKTLTITLNPAATDLSRVRVYGANTVCDANLNLVDSRTVFASYQGTQMYNGVISGAGSFMQKGAIAYLNGASTYSGGTTPATGYIGLGTSTTVDGGGTVLSGPIGTGPLSLFPDSTTSTTGSGGLLAFGGPRTIANPIQYQSGTNNLTLIIGGTNALTFSGPITLNGNDGLGGPVNRIFQVTNTALTTFSGDISDLGSAGFGLTKTGPGTLALDGIATYTGATTVSNGTLQVNGQLAAASAVTVTTNATLGGIGTIGGSVSVNAGGTIAPGTSIGTLNIGGNLSLAGTLNIEVNKSASPTSDKVALSGALNVSATGAITVTNLGPALAKGDTFAIFDKAVANGGSLPITGANMVWVNKLAVNGTIEVLSGVAAPVTIGGITPAGISYNGGAGSEFVLMQSPMVAPASWTPVTTNTATPGVFPIVVGTGQSYFRILSR